MVLAVSMPGVGGAADTGSAYDRAIAAFRARHYQEAIALLGPVISTDPRNVRALVLRGDCKAQLKDNEGALDDYNAAIAYDPEYQYAYVTRCETRLDVGNVDGALADCDVAIRLSPKDSLAYEDRGDAYFEREQYDLALSDYDKSIAFGRSTDLKGDTRLQRFCQDKINAALSIFVLAE